MADFQSLFDRHVGASMLRQEALAEQVGGARWGVDLDRQTLSVQTDPPRTLAVQVLGSESESSRTWMWGWANVASQLPPASLRQVERLRDFGAANAIPELTTPVLPVREWDGHRLSMVAAGLADAPGYFCCPYDGGALFVLITEPSPRTAVELPVLRLTRALPQALTAFRVVDHRLTLEGLATWLGLRLEPEGEVIRVTGTDGSATVRFDAQHRVAEIKGELSRD